MNRMPALFIGHGSPMNALEDNQYTRNWQKIAQQIPRPEAILSVSAHWYTEGSFVSDSADPEMVYDMYGFPPDLYRIRYPAAGAPALAHLTQNLIQRTVGIDNSWGLDHGTWSVLCRMYPEADIPVYQLSVDSSADAGTHLKIGQEIQSLRDKGVMIFGSGNVVHNLGRVSWGMQGGYSWAEEFDGYIKDKVVKRDFDGVVQYGNAGRSSEEAFRTPDHFYPLLCVLGASGEDDKLTVFNDSCTLGSLSMTSYLFTS